MDGKIKGAEKQMSFRFEGKLPLEVQIECAAKVFADEEESGELPNVCAVPKRYLKRLPDKIGTMTIVCFLLRPIDPPNEYWVGRESRRAS